MSNVAKWCSLEGERTRRHCPTKRQFTVRTPLDCGFLIHVLFYFFLHRFQTVTTSMQHPLSVPCLPTARCIHTHTLISYLWILIWCWPVPCWSFWSLPLYFYLEKKSELNSTSSWISWGFEHMVDINCFILDSYLTFASNVKTLLPGVVNVNNVTFNRPQKSVNMMSKECRP